MEQSSAISDEHQAIVDRRRCEDVLLQGIGPQKAVRGNIPCFCSVDAFKPSLILAPPNIPAACDIEAVVSKHRHAVEVTWTFATVAVEGMDVCLGRAGVKVEGPDPRETGGFGGRPGGLGGRGADGGVGGLECVNES